MNFGGAATLFCEIKMAYFPSEYFFLRILFADFRSGCEGKITFS